MLHETNVRVCKFSSRIKFTTRVYRAPHFLFLSVTCAFPEGREVAAGYSEEVRSEEGQRSADVVFVVDESECNSWARIGIPRMAAQLENALLAQGQFSEL